MLKTTLLFLLAAASLTVADFVVEFKDCVFRYGESPNVDKWDLNPLTTTFSGKDTDGNKYTVDFCKNTCGNNSVCKYSSSGSFLKGLGSSITEPLPLGYVIESTDPSAGIQLEFSTEDYDFATVFLICDENANSDVLTVSSDGYLTQLKIQTPYGCPNYGGKTGGLSGGWIFIIILLVATTLYFVIGYVICVKRFGKTGKEAIPHLAFWNAIPAWTAAGIKLTIAKARSLVSQRSTVTTSGDYDNL